MRLLVFILWLLLGLVYWYISGKCCPDTNVKEKTEIISSPVESETQIAVPQKDTKINSD